MKIDKIYSRKKKFRLPQIYHYKRGNLNIKDINNNVENNNILKNENKSNKKIIKIILILFIAIAVAVNIISAINPILETLCIAEAKKIATIVSNEETSKVMKNYTYDDLTIIEKTEDGKIQYIKSNVIVINEIISEISKNIQNELSSKDRSKLYIRLGSFSGISLFSGRGPKIEVIISSVGHIETNLRSELSSAGINQTLHRIILDLKCNVTILTPYNEISTEIENQVILAEDVIIGEIPSTYYNLEGLNSGDTLEVIE